MRYLICIGMLTAALLVTGCRQAESKEPVELENYGEGTSSVELPDLKEEELVEADNKILVQTENTDYQILIDDVSFTDKRNEFEAEYKQVVLVTYTYENHGQEPLLIDDLRFQLISMDETKIYMPYYLSDMLYAEIAEQGQSVTAQVAFGIEDDSNAFKLIYKDTSSVDVLPKVLDIVLQ